MVQKSIINTLYTHHTHEDFTYCESDSFRIKNTQIIRDIFGPPVKLRKAVESEV